MIVALRKKRPHRGPKKLRTELLELHPGKPWPAASTFGDILTRYGLIRPRRRRVRVMPAKQPFADCTAPNDTWCVDFKGHFRLGDGTRCYPLTITDAHSRYCIKIESLTLTDTAHVRPLFEQAFAEFGLPRRIRSDNGPPFASPGRGRVVDAIGLVAAARHHARTNRAGKAAAERPSRALPPDAQTRGLQPARTYACCAAARVRPFSPRVQRSAAARSTGPDATFSPLRTIVASLSHRARHAVVWRRAQDALDERSRLLLVAWQAGLHPCRTR